MSILKPELEIVDRSIESVRYLEHGWPTDLCRWHAHIEYELHFIVGTSGTAFVGDYIGDFGPKSLFLTGPYLPHNWVTDTAGQHEVPVRDKLVQFSQEGIDGLVSGFPEFTGVKPLLEHSASGVEFFNFDAGYIERKLDHCRDHPGIKRVVTLLEMLTYLATEAEFRPLSVVKFRQNAQGRMETQIGSAVDYVVKHFAEELSVGKISREVGLSETSFSRRFKEITGNRFTEFVNRVRVGEACARLQQTPDPVSSICFDVGYQNLANFNRHFHKMKGLTPTEYREQMRIAHVRPGGRR